jgi:hypothetical protein
MAGMRWQCCGRMPVPFCAAEDDEKRGFLWRPILLSGSRQVIVESMAPGWQILWNRAIHLGTEPLFMRLGRGESGGGA